MIVVYVTYLSLEEAQKISKLLLEERLAACANIMAAHQALYWWEGAVQDSFEVAVLYKTRQTLFDQLKDLVLAHHSYECPCVVSWSIVQGNQGFLDWIAAETR